MLGHILETAFSDIGLNILNPTIATIMISGTSAILDFRTKTRRKYKYVCLLGSIVAMLVTSWTYASLPLPPKSYSTAVVIWVFLVRLLAAMFWGTCTWGVYRALLKARGADRPASPRSTGKV